MPMTTLLPATRERMMEGTSVESNHGLGQLLLKYLPLTNYVKIQGSENALPGPLKVWEGTCRSEGLWNISFMS